MMTLIVPLWALDIGASAFWIGMAIAMRALLAMVFSIQTGAVMDRLGARKVSITFGLIGQHWCCYTRWSRAWAGYCHCR